MPSPLLVERSRMVTNLLTLYRQQVTPDDYQLGLAWYPNAHRIVCEWADHYERSIANVASIVAALSPQCSWERNLIAADDVLAGNPVSIGGVLGANIAKAERIYHDRASDITTYFPHGPKVASFAANLAGDWHFVTVDGHALQAALADVTSTRTLRWSAYAAIAGAYQSAAWSVGIQPAHFQAILWHTWKRLNPPVVKRAVRRRW